MYQEVVLPGFALPPHPCPGCGKSVPRGCSGLLTPRSVKERHVKSAIENEEIRPLEPGTEVEHLERCPFQRLHPALLLACKSKPEMEALLGELGIDPTQAGPTTPGVPPHTPG